jgi:hypothetical protein
MNEADTPGLRELSELADELLEQATEIRRQWGELAEVLGADLDAGTRGARGSRFVRKGSETAETMRLVAIDMLLSGHGRTEIGAYLRDAFSAEDVRPVLDEVFADFAMTDQEPGSSRV